MIAVIDVGSNAIRMALGDATSSSVKILKSFRAPIRLGEDSFTQGKISEETISRLIDTFNVFQDIIKQSKVTFTKAVATSAMREAQNKIELIKRINRESKIQLEVIDAKEESRLIHLAVTKGVDLKKKRALIVDIGGGSIEFIYSNNEKFETFKSLRIGTVRLSQILEGKPEYQHRDILKEEVKKTLKKLSELKVFFECNSDKKIFIATGGNVRTLQRISKEVFRNSDKETIDQIELNMITRLISTYTFEEKIRTFGLRKDRADVILPACVILEETMKDFGFNQICTPKVGLKDGILFDISKKFK